VTRNEVYALIDGERDHQKAKWGDKPLSVPGYLLVLRAELDEAIEAWVKTEDDQAAMDEIRQVAAVAVAAMEWHEAPARES
jgi:NTP pyrophosphatase (non-canonical NTP hydrolase)